MVEVGGGWWVVGEWYATARLAGSSKPCLVALLRAWARWTSGRVAGVVVGYADGCFVDDGMCGQ